MNIVMLDRNSIGEDIDVSIFEEFGEVSYHNTATINECKEWIKDAEVIIFNKAKMNEEMLKDAPNVKLLCITATGYDNIDIEYAKKRGIAVCNVRGYSTATVVQHTFTLALYLLEKISFYNEFVQSGEYSKQNGFSNFSALFHELDGKTWGIVGMGNIGRSVAKIASAFGCKIIFYSPTGKSTITEYEKVEFESLLKESDIISLHCPLSDLTRNLFDKVAFEKMKTSALLINVARGPVVNDEDLAVALQEETIAGAGLDVLTVEPMAKENPLATIKDGTKLIITPHMAWASVEARTRCMEEILKNIHSFNKGEKRNRLDI
ncbi:MAG: D-2-hydroxyacid dehydrogenase [Lachnospiraceae bacterium]